MATRQLSVKFDTEGFQSAISQLQAIGKAFDVVLSNAQNNIKKARAEIAAASNNGSIDQMAEGQKLLEQNIKIANRAIAASYRELGIKSAESLNMLRAQAVSAFEAIKISGTATATDITRAQDALNNKLKQLESQLNSQKVNAYKTLGVQSREELIEARQQIIEAYAVINKSANNTKSSQQELALAYRAMVEKTSAISKQLNQTVASNDLDAAYKLLGVRSETELKKARDEIVQAYNLIRNAAKPGSRDDAATLEAMKSRIAAINAELGIKDPTKKLTDAYKSLGFRSEADLKKAEQDIKLAYEAIANSGTKSQRDIKLAAELLQQKLKEISQELNSPTQKQDLQGAYKTLGVRSEAELIKARNEIVLAWNTISLAGKQSARDMGLAYEAMQAKIKQINSEIAKTTQSEQLGDAYKLLGVRSEAELKKARDEIIQAYNSIRNATKPGSRDDTAALEAMRSRLKTINAELFGAIPQKSIDPYKALGFRSEAELKKVEQDVRAAYDAIAKSGTASQRDIRLAAELLQQKLKEINQELNKTLVKNQEVEGAYRVLGVRSLPELIKARNEIIQAWNTISAAGKQSARDMGLAYEAMQAKIKQIDSEIAKTAQSEKLGNAYKLLGVRSEAELKKARDEIIQAYNLIRNAAKPGSRDDAAALEAMRSRLKLINDELAGVKNPVKAEDPYKALGFRSEAEVKKTIREIADAYDYIRKSGIASQRDIETAADALQKKVRQLTNELRSVQDKGVQDAYKLLGVKSEAELNEAIRDIEQAFKTVVASKTRTDGDIVRAEEAMLSKVKQLRAEIARTGAPVATVNDAYKLLGVRSEADIIKAKNDIKAAFNEILVAGSKRDINVAQDAMIAKLKQLDTELKGTSTSTNILTTSIGYLSSAIKMQLAYSVSGLLLNIPSSISGLIGQFAAFQREISTLKAISGGTTGEIAAVRGEVERLGRTTSKTPEDIAKLSVSLARAGYDAGQITSALNGMVKASEAAGEDLDRVGTIITGVLKAYNLPASESGRIADLLTQTANKAAVSVSDLGESLKYVGTVAAGSNQKVEDVLVVLGLMGNVMLKSGQAGRNYAQTLEKMKISSAGMSDELLITSRGLATAADAAKALGVSFRDSNGQLRPFLDILPELKEKMKALPQQDQDVIARILFGVEGGRAVQTTLRATGKDIDYLAEALKKADGVADRTSKVINDDLTGSLNSLAGSAKVLSNLIVDQVSPGIKASIDGVIKIVNSLSINVSTLIGILGGLAVSGVTGLVIAAFKAMGVAIAALIVQMKAAGGAAALFRVGLTALLSPTNLVIAAVGVLAGTLIKFSVDAKQAREGALALGSALDSLSARKDKLALIELEEQERKAREGLTGIDEEIKRKKANIEASGAGWDWLPGNKFNRQETEREVRRLEAERENVVESLGRINSTRQQIQDNIAGKNKPQSDFANRQPTIGAPIPPRLEQTQPVRQGGSGKTRPVREQRLQSQEFYEYPVIRPTSGPISSPYGMRTFRGKTRFHDGIDLAPPLGTPVKATLPGRVTKVAYEEGGAGHYVTVETIDKAGKKIEQTFMHLVTRALVGVGETVKQGDIIGRVGSTGRSSGPHLHWRTRINGQSINPRDFEKMQFTLPGGDGKPSDYLRQQDAANYSEKTEKNPLIQEILAMSKRLGMNPLDILRVMMFETGGTLSPKAHGNGAVGLIGFTKDNEKELGITLKELAKKSAVEQIPYVEKYLQIHARGQKLDSYQKVASTVFYGNPGGSLNVGDGRITLGNYLRVADKRYGEKARNLISQNDIVAKESMEQKADFQEQKQDVRSERSKSYLETSQEIIDNEKYKIQEEFAQRIYDLKIQSLDADEINRSYLEQEIKLQELLFNAHLKELDLIGKQQQINEQILILETDKASLSQPEIEKLKELYKERTKITREIASANKESERAITLQQLEANAARETAIEKLRGELEPILESITPKKMLEGVAKDLNEVTVAILKQKNSLDKKMQDATLLGDAASIDNITNGLSELNKQLPNFISSNLSTIRGAIPNPISSENLKSYQKDEIAREQAIGETQKYYAKLRLDSELLITTARKNGYQDILEKEKDLLDLIDKTGQAQIKKIRDQGNILVQVATTAKEAFASGVSQLFSDLVSGTKSLEDAFNSFASSILKAIADLVIQMAAQQTVKWVIKSIGGGYADGGYVSGPGTGRSDSIPARLSNGEFVMSANSVKHWGVGLLNNMNNRGMPDISFQSPSGGSPNVSRSPKIIMNVTTPDANSFRRSETQIGKNAGEQLRRSMYRNG